MNKENIKTLEEVRAEHRAQQEQERQRNFIKGLDGKTFDELNLQQLNYLYQNHKKTYDKILNNRQEKVKDIETLSVLKAQEKERKEMFEKMKPQKANNEAEARLEKIVNDSIDNVLKKFGL